MKLLQRLLLTLTFTSLIATTLAEPATTIQFLYSFDYPGATSTTPIGINDRGDISGYYVDGTISPAASSDCATAPFSQGSSSLTTPGT